MFNGNPQYIYTHFICMDVCMFTFILFSQLVAHHHARMVEHVTLQIGVSAMQDGLGHHVKLV